MTNFVHTWKSFKRLLPKSKTCYFSSRSSPYKKEFLLRKTSVVTRIFLYFGPFAMSDEKVIGPRRQSLLNFFSPHDIKKKVHPKFKEENKTKGKEKGDEKRRSLQDTYDVGVNSYHKRDLRRRTQSVCVPSKKPVKSRIELQNFEEVNKRKNSTVEDEIIKAMHEARTVSVIDGDVYIDCEYVGPLPIGCRV